jgi:hypothetical protein
MASAIEIGLLLTGKADMAGVEKSLSSLTGSLGGVSKVMGGAMIGGAAAAGAGQANATPALSWTGHLSSGTVGACTIRAYAGSTARSSTGALTSAEFIKLY